MKTHLLLTLLTAAAAGSTQAALVYSQTFDVYDDVPTSTIYYDATAYYSGTTSGPTGANLTGNPSLNGRLVTSNGGRLPQSGANFLLINTGAGETLGEIWGTNSSQVVTVEVGQVYEFSFYVAGINGISPAQLSPRVNGVALENLNVDEEVNPGVATYAGVSDWVKHTYRWEADTTTADLSLVNLTAVATGNDFHLDTITFSSVPVPEPGVTLLGALGLLGLVRRRR